MFHVLCFGSQVSGSGCRVSGFGFRVSGFGFRVSGLGFPTLVGGEMWKTTGEGVGGARDERSGDARESGLRGSPGRQPRMPGPQQWHWRCRTVHRASAQGLGWEWVVGVGGVGGGREGEGRG